MTDSFLSLMYHNVCPAGWDSRPESARLSPSITRYFTDDRMFAEHLRTLGRHAACLTHSDLALFFSDARDLAGSAVRRAAGPAPPGEASPAMRVPRVQITFDDGWRDSVELGGPLLEAHGWQALLFVTTDFLGHPQFVTRTHLQGLPPHVFRVGSHAQTHRFLNELPHDQVRCELATSKAVLENVTGREVDAVSVPNGAVDERVRQIAADVGYRFVFTSDVHVNTRPTGRLNIGRFAVRRTTTADEIARVVGAGFAAETLRRRLLAIPKRLLGPRAYRRLRGLLLGANPDHCDMAEILEDTHRVV
jgi:peptidoglycan/xylan/chitin deacetylase (PgdA/CDA1 family)